MQQSDARPFFLLVGLTAPHSPWDGHPKRFVDLYSDTDSLTFPGRVISVWRTGGGIADS